MQSNQVGQTGNEFRYNLTTKQESSQSQASQTGIRTLRSYLGILRLLIVDLQGEGNRNTPGHTGLKVKLGL